MQEFIVGRAGNQPFDITADGVHNKHVRITISDQGTWTLEDLKGDSGNGTYIKDEQGSFNKVYRVQITPNTIIRLAKGGFHSYTFMAHRVLAKKDDYGYEFETMRRRYRSLKEEEEKQENTNIKHVQISKWAPIIGLILSMTTTNLWLVRICITIPSFLVGQIFGGDAQKLKAIRLRRINTAICPCCGRPLSDFDVNNMQCSVCKAK